MIILDKKKKIPANLLVHSLNHTYTSRGCMLNSNYSSSIPKLDYTFSKRINNIPAGLYRITVDDADYVIDLYYNITDDDHIWFKNLYQMFMVINGTYFPVIPYKIISEKSFTQTVNIYNTINDNISMIMVVGKTTIDGTPSVDSPMQINRIENVSFTTTTGSHTDTFNYANKYHLGKLPNGVHDILVINAEQMVTHNVIRTNKEILSGGLPWEYKEDLSTEDYYVFYSEYKYVKQSSTGDCIRCSHFSSTEYSTLVNTSSAQNYIAVSNTDNNNGLWVKIAASVLDIHGDKDYAQEFSKWLARQAVSSEPVYIEYELAEPKYVISTMDEYHLKTWRSIVNIKSDGDYGFSIFYKGLF